MLCPSSVSACPTHRGAPPEQRLPSGIAQHHRRAAIQVGRTERAALRGGHAQRFEEARRDRFAQRAARFAAPGECVLHPLPSGDAIERAALAVEDLHIAIAGEHLGIPVVGSLPDGRQARRIAEGQRAQQHPVHQAEDQGIGADAQGQQQNRGRGEAGALAQRAGGVSEIGDELAHWEFAPRYHNGFQTPDAKFRVFTGWVRNLAAVLPDTLMFPQCYRSSSRFTTRSLPSCVCTTG